MKMKSFVLYLTAVLLCLSLGSCKGEQTAEERDSDLEVTEDKTDSISKVDKGDGFARRTKAQYVIY